VATTGLPANLQFVTSDTIRTHNDFYGGQVGFDLDMSASRFIMDIRVMAALGVMHQTVDVFSTSVLPGGSVVAGGLLSSPFDQGRHNRDRISAIPEVNVKLGYLITPRLRAYVGYDFMYIANTLRPGEQTGVSTSGIQVTVAGATTPITVSQPAFRFHDSDVWINGINFGLELRF
jgi:hypothetical protein